MNSKLKAYQSTRTLGLSQLDLILKVYDGALDSFRQAGAAYNSGDNSKGYEQLERAKRFITHLYTTLDPEKGGEIAEKLGKIYAYLLNQTNLAQATKELKIIDDNIKVLGNIREGWQMLKKQTEAGKLPQDTAPKPGGLEKFTTTA